MLIKPSRKPNGKARMQKLSNGPLNKLSGEEFELWLDSGHNNETGILLSKTLEKMEKKKKFF